MFVEYFEAMDFKVKKIKTLSTFISSYTGSNALLVIVAFFKNIGPIRGLEKNCHD